MTRCVFALSFTLLTPFSTAHAQYNPYLRPGKAAVVLDMSVLEEQGNAPEKVEQVIILTPPAPATAPTPAVPPPIAAMPSAPISAPTLLPTPKRHPAAEAAQEEPAPIPEAKPEPYTAPAEKPLRKPDPEEEIAAEPEGVEMPEVDVTEQVMQAAAPAAAPPAEARPPAPVVPGIDDLMIAFEGNSADLPSGAREKIDNATAHMKSMDSGRLQIRAYATGEDANKGSARRISLARALAVRARMMEKGIDPARLDVRALGAETDRSPADRVDLVFAR